MEESKGSGRRWGGVNAGCCSPTASLAVLLREVERGVKGDLVGPILLLYHSPTRQKIAENFASRGGKRQLIHFL